MTRPYGHTDWNGYRQRFHTEDGGPFVVCHGGFGWYGQWLAGPFDTFDEADAAREPARRQFRDGEVSPMVVAVRAT